MKLVIFAVFLLGVIADEDDGSAFKVKWTKKDAESCKTGKGVYVENCKHVKVDGVVNVMDLDNCVAWIKATTKDKKFNSKNFCKKFRRGCFHMKEQKAAKLPSKPEMIVWCAEAYHRHYSVYEADIAAGYYTPNAPGKETKPAEKPDKETKPAKKPNKETKPAKKPE